ncbi:hypothetical protein EYF80_004717 [Liparis tanakae]|uniref:Uncharacterized protein n=1 Tax=Liparis tanakae TaxID=230148 RepID=A0A4Z2J688_9TELE|nr:hypothetical protein EYF80_004717 [Liparis tanakae]
MPVMRSVGAATGGADPRSSATGGPIRVDTVQDTENGVRGGDGEEGPVRTQPEHVTQSHGGHALP